MLWLVSNSLRLNSRVADVFVQSSDNALVKTAGVQCLNMLTQQIGRMIMRGRIEQQNSRLVTQLCT